MITIFILSLVGAIIAAVIGTFWYSQMTPMGRLHMKVLGFDALSPEEQQKKIAEAKPKMPKIYSAQILLSFITAFAVVFMVQMSLQNGLSVGMALAFPIFNWFCFIVPTIGSSILWGNIDRSLAWKKFFSDILSILVTIICVSILAVIFA